MFDEISQVAKFQHLAAIKKIIHSLKLTCVRWFEISPVTFHEDSCSFEKAFEQRE